MKDEIVTEAVTEMTVRLTFIRENASLSSLPEDLLALYLKTLVEADDVNIVKIQHFEKTKRS